MNKEEIKDLRKLSLKSRLLSVILCNYLDAKEKDMTEIGKAELRFLEELPMYIDNAIALTQSGENPRPCGSD